MANCGGAGFVAYGTAVHGQCLYRMCFIEACKRLTRVILCIKAPDIVAVHELTRRSQRQRRVGDDPDGEGIAGLAVIRVDTVGEIEETTGGNHGTRSRCTDGAHRLSEYEGSREDSKEQDQQCEGRHHGGHLLQDVPNYGCKS